MFGQGLLKGLRVTGRRMVGKPQCDMYPYRKRTLPPKSRVFLSMHASADGTPACRACLSCMTTCPDHVISIERDPEDRKRALSFTVDSGRCTFCGLCEEGCTFGALTFTQDFERATFERGTLTYALIDDGAATAARVVDAPSDAPKEAEDAG